MSTLVVPENDLNSRIDLANEWLTEYSIATRLTMWNQSLGVALQRLDARLDAMLGETWRTATACGHDFQLPEALRNHPKKWRNPS